MCEHSDSKLVNLNPNLSNKGKHIDSILKIKIFEEYYPKYSDKRNL